MTMVFRTGSFFPINILSFWPETRAPSPMVYLHSLSEVGKLQDDQRVQAVLKRT